MSRFNVHDTEISILVFLEANELVNPI